MKGLFSCFLPMVNLPGVLNYVNSIWGDSELENGNYGYFENHLA